VSNVPTYDWSGQSGRKYQYWIYPIGQSFYEKPGNYIFVKETSPGRWTPCYIGQTENLNQRLGDHEKEACAKRNGATHIHVHLSSDNKTERCAEETDLIQQWKPPCNEVGTEPAKKSFKRAQPYQR